MQHTASDQKRLERPQPASHSAAATSIASVGQKQLPTAITASMGTTAAAATVYTAPTTTSNVRSTEQNRQCVLHLVHATQQEEPELWVGDGSQSLTT